MVTQEFSFGHVAFAMHVRHPRRDEDITLEFRGNVLARNTNSGVDGICMGCKPMRLDEGPWGVSINKRSGTLFIHKVVQPSPLSNPRTLGLPWLSSG